jgi:predicted GNAT superfamily acetyltransferase
MVDPPVLRAGRAPDHDQVVAINQAAVPAVGPMDQEHLERLLTWTESFTVVERDTVVVGFCLLMAEGQDYPSVNYRWFSRQYERFIYVDRIAIAPSAQGQGLGGAVYRAMAEHGRGGGWPVLTAEVNLVPRNDQSLAFHARCGFVEVGQQETPDGKWVSLLALEL